MASTAVEVAGATARVAALAVVNASGSPVDPRTGAPWIPIAAIRRPDAAERRAVDAARRAATAPPLNTTIGVVATDADLSRAETGRLAQSAHDGLARAIRPAHGLTDGDTVFGLATGAIALPPTPTGLLRGAASRSAQLNQLFAAAADVFAIACVDAILTASSRGTATAYADLCPSAFRV
jgi:L-aminopeptidase/D-esterase-like protein